MTDRRRIAVLASAALLLLLLYIVSGVGTSGIGTGGSGTSSERALFPELVPERVESLRIRFAANAEEEKTYRIVRRNDEWMLDRNGILRPANDEQVGKTLRELAELTFGDKVTEKRSVRKRLGVSSGTADVVGIGYRKPGEQVVTSATVYVGASVPGTSRRYVRRSGVDKIFSVRAPEFLQHPELSHWAELRLFPSSIAPSNIIRLSLKSFQGNEIELIRRETSDGEWFLKRKGGEVSLPSQGSKRVLQFLRTLFMLRGTSFAPSCRPDDTPLILIRAESDRGKKFPLEVYPLHRGEGYIVCARGVETRDPLPFTVREEDFKLLTTGLERILATVSK